MISTISILSMLLVGCQNSEKKEEAPAKTEQQIKDEAKEAAKKELEAEAKKKEEDAKKAEEEKAALKEEIKEEIKEEAKKEEDAKKEEEAKEEAKKPKKKAAPSEKTFNTRVSVDELPLKGRKARFEAAAKKSLSAIAGKAGYNNMKGSLAFQGPKPACKGGKCIWKVSGTFTK